MASTSDLIINEVRKVIHGKDEVIKLTLCAILAGGHVLLEDIPGVGKTTLAVSISSTLSGIQTCTVYTGRNARRSHRFQYVR